MMIKLSNLLSMAFLGLPNLNFSAEATAPALNLTAISARKGNSVLECWQLPDLVSSTQKGTSGASNLFLGNTANATYNIIPAGFDGGIHNAPTPQIVVFLSGLAHVTLPNSTDEAWIQGGRYGTIIAVDTAAVSKFGHITTYPSDADTVALAIPFENGVFPKHTVLHSGPCTFPELTGV